MQYVRNERTAQNISFIIIHFRLMFNLLYLYINNIYILFIKISFILLSVTYEIYIFKIMKKNILDFFKKF